MGSAAIIRSIRPALSLVSPSIKSSRGGGAESKRVGRGAEHQLRRKLVADTFCGLDPVVLDNGWRRGPDMYLSVCGQRFAIEVKLAEAESRDRSHAIWWRETVERASRTNDVPVPIWTRHSTTRWHVVVSSDWIIGDGGVGREDIVTVSLWKFRQLVQRRTL